MAGISEAMKEARATWLLVVIGLIAGVLVYALAGDEMQEVWFAIVAIIVCSGFVTLFARVAPYFKIAPETKLAGMLFYLMAAATYFVLAIKTFDASISVPPWLASSWYMLMIHTTLALVLWRFILGVQHARVEDPRSGHERTRSTDD